MSGINNKGPAFAKLVYQYLRSKYKVVKVEVPMKGGRADFVTEINGKTEVWEAKSSCKIVKAHIDQAARNAGDEGDPKLVVNKHASISDAVKKHAKSKKVEIVKIDTDKVKKE